jgi:hypothetical protein
MIGGKACSNGKQAKGKYKASVDGGLSNTLQTSIGTQCRGWTIVQPWLGRSKEGRQERFDLECKRKTRSPTVERVFAWLFPRMWRADDEIPLVNG